jgi:hypothetical protein
MKYFFAILATISFLFNSCDTNAQKKMSQVENVKIFINKFADFKMDIQGAGIATIPKATLSKTNELYIEYAYFSEGENRTGKMTLTENANHRFIGNWKTTADNGNVYQGTLYFDFEEDGEAQGYYKFAGSDYKIRIFIPTKK